jgi:hypothetical protein
MYFSIRNIFVRVYTRQAEKHAVCAVSYGLIDAPLALDDKIKEGLQRAWMVVAKAALPHLQTLFVKRQRTFEFRLAIE